MNDTELKIENGEYVKNKFGGFETVSGDEETVQRALMKLKARRGAFPPLPGYGSGLYALAGVKRSQRAAAARQMVHEALSGETEAEVEDVEYREDGRGMGYVTVSLKLAGGERTELTMETGGIV